MTQTSINTITPINRDELVRLSEKGKGNPGAVRTLKAKTVLESKFRHLNYIRNLAPHVIDEPPGLLGDDTAPNPSEAAHGTGGNETDLIPLGQSLDLTKQNPREVMKDNEILQYFEAADLSDGF